MSVTVTLFPTLRNLSASKRESFALEWREGLTARDVLAAEGFNERDSEAVLAVVNEAQSTLDAPLADGDALELRVNIQGGGEESAALARG